MRKKIIGLSILAVSLTLFSFRDIKKSGGRYGVVKLADGNYIMDTPVNFTTAEMKKFESLEAGNPQFSGRFFFSCYERGPNRFRHGRIWGSACCTSPGPTVPTNPDDCPPFMRTKVDNARIQIDMIMARYL